MFRVFITKPKKLRILKSRYKNKDIVQVVAVRLRRKCIAFGANLIFLNPTVLILLKKIYLHITLVRKVHYKKISNNNGFSCDKKNLIGFALRTGSENTRFYFQYTLNIL